MLCEVRERGLKISFLANQNPRAGVLFVVKRPSSIDTRRNGPRREE